MFFGGRYGGSHRDQLGQVSGVSVFRPISTTGGKMRQRPLTPDENCDVLPPLPPRQQGFANQQIWPSNILLLTGKLNGIWYSITLVINKFDEVV